MSEFIPSSPPKPTKTKPIKTNIEIYVMNRQNESVTTIIIKNKTITAGDFYITEIYPGNRRIKTEIDLDYLIDQYFSQESNAVEEHTEIHIHSLAPRDLEYFNELFQSGTYTIPDCVSFLVDPNVGLVNRPVINPERVFEKCAICLEDINPNETMSRISGHQIGVQYCEHKFHEDCIKEYCRIKTEQGRECECPLCRAPIEPYGIENLGGKNRLRKMNQRKTRRSKNIKKTRKNAKKSVRR